jgi:hypothetical protein
MGASKSKKIEKIFPHVFKMAAILKMAEKLGF